MSVKRHLFMPFRNKKIKEGRELKMKRKALVVLISVLLLVSVFSGCNKTTKGTDGTTTAKTTTASGTTTSGTTATTAPQETSNFNKTGYPIVNEPITLKAMNTYQSNGGPWGEEMSFFRAMKELTNIDFEFANIPATDWSTKMNLSLASGDLPDVYLSSIGASNIVNYGVEGGMLVDVSDMIDDYMPHMLSWLDEWPDLLKIVTEINGGIYTFPRLIAGSGDHGVTMSVRLDFMHAAGIHKEPETVDEFYTMLKAIQNANADKEEFYTLLAPLTPDSPFERYMVAAFGDYTDTRWNDDGTGKVIFNGITDQFYRYLEFANRIFTEKIACNEIYTMDSATQTALHKGNKTAVSMSYTMLSLDNFESGNFDVTILAPLTSQYTSVKKTRHLPGLQYTGIAITKECKHVEALLRYLDVSYAKEDVVPGLNTESTHVGVRGETWDYADESKKTYKFLMPSDWTLSSTEFIYHKCGPSYIYMDTWTIIPEGTSPGLVVKCNDSVNKLFPYMVPNFPLDNLKYTKDEFDRYSTLWTDINQHRKTMTAKFITGEVPLSYFPTYVQELNNMGLPELRDIIQKAYDRYNGK